MRISRETWREIGIMTAGDLIMVAGIYFFKYPNHFSTGGVSGISVVLAHWFPVTPGTVGLIVNVALLLLGYLLLGRGFGVKTAYVTLLQAGVLRLLEILLPERGVVPLTDQPMLELIFAVTLPAIGSAMLFNIGASSGGTDIVAMVMRKHTSMDIGKALMCSDLLITLMAWVAFGPQAGLYSILGLVTKSLLVDMVLENFHTHKCFQIITAHPEEIERFVTGELHRGATRVHGEGVYTHEGREVLLTVVNRHQAVMLRHFVRRTDPGAFLIITNSSEIIGKGFRGLD
ncbi:MAG: YitT family protein [Clostridia bacterium]|nr:YitT family protein [Clostridia bacterium]